MRKIIEKSYSCIRKNNNIEVTYDITSKVCCMCFIVHDLLGIDDKIDLSHCGSTELKIGINPSYASSSISLLFMTLKLSNRQYTYF